MKLCNELHKSPDLEAGVEAGLAFSLQRLNEFNGALGKRCLQDTSLRLQVRRRPERRRSGVHDLYVLPLVQRLRPVDRHRQLAGVNTQRALQVAVPLDGCLLRDTVIWDVAQPYNTAELYASGVCEDLGLRHNWFCAIAGHVQQLLADVGEVRTSLRPRCKLRQVAHANCTCCACKCGAWETGVRRCLSQRSHPDGANSAPSSVQRVLRTHMHSGLA